MNKKGQAIKEIPGWVIVLAFIVLFFILLIVFRDALFSGIAQSGGVFRR